MADFKPSDGSHGFLAEVEQLLNDALGSPHGTLEFKGILDRHGGGDIYIPTSTEVYNLWRQKQIRARFTGSNYQELADETGLSARHIRRIIHDDK